MTILFPTTCWINGVRGWKLNQRVTLSGWFPSAATALLQPAGGGLYGSCPRGAFGVPFPSALGSVMKIQPVLDGGSCAESTGSPPLGMGPLGKGVGEVDGPLARDEVVVHARGGDVLQVVVARVRRQPRHR